MNTSDFTYDAAGQLTNVARFGSMAYTAEGHLRSINNYATGSYVYNSFGERTLAVSNNSYWKEYVYLGGQPIAELDSSGAWTDDIFANGQRIARVSNSDTKYYLYDHLGTAQLELPSSGNYVEDHFTPFGQQVFPTSGTSDYIGALPPDPVVTPYKFLGNERDQESGLDYFNARMFASSLGRFSTPDPSGLAFADIGNPQSLNLYTYGLNNPLSFMDPSGLNSDCFQGEDGACNGREGDHSDSMIADLPNFFPCFTSPGCNPPPPPPPTQPDDGRDDVDGIMRDASGSAVVNQGGSNNRGAGVPGQQMSHPGVIVMFPAGSTVCGDFICAPSGKQIGVATPATLGIHEKNTLALMVIGGALGFADVFSGEYGTLYGTKKYGNIGNGLLNRNDSLRFGWSHLRSGGARFRIGGDLVKKYLKSDGHINLWPPSWWSK